jgi:hypothetical protein
MSINPNLNTVGGAFIGPFSGPGIMVDFQVSSGVSQTAVADYDLAYRCDFSRNSQLDAFTTVANFLPTGVSTAEDTLFKHTSIRDYTVGVGDLTAPGWVSLRLFAAGDGMTWRDMMSPINLDTFYIKVYCAKDGTGMAYKVNGRVLAR